MASRKEAMYSWPPSSSRRRRAPWLRDSDAALPSRSAAGRTMWQTLRGSIVADRDRRSALTLAVEAGRRQPHTWAHGSAGVAFGQEACLHEIFEAQVARTPDAIALVCDGQ